MLSIDKLKEKLILRITPILGYLLVLTIGRTLRFTVLGEYHLESIRQRKQKIIYTAWHGEMFALIFFHRRRKIYVLISQHRDGELIYRIIKKMGYYAVRGSSTYGGTEALQQMVNLAVQGYDLAITPDGPRGPRHVIQPGVISLALKTGLPIVPVTCGARHKLVLNSWDRFIIPLPFTKCVIIYGEPVYIFPPLDTTKFEENRLTLERKLKQLTQQAESLV